MSEFAFFAQVRYNEITQIPGRISVFAYINIATPSLKIATPWLLGALVGALTSSSRTHVVATFFQKLRWEISK